MLSIELVRLRAAAKRDKQTEQEAAEHRTSDRLRAAAKRDKQTEQEAAEHRTSDRLRAAAKRDKQTEQEAAERRISNRLCTAAKRNKQTEQEVAERNAKKRCMMASVRTKEDIDIIIKEFLAKVKIGPEYVCTYCHRMLYRHAVIGFKPTKYTKATPELLKKLSEHAYVSSDGKQWVCKTCDGALCRGNLPVQAKANGMELDSEPTEMSCLNALEQRLISLRVPFMKMVALPSGKQRCIHGPAVNVPSNVDRVCTMLPRLPSECELVPLKLKRKLSYKGHYLYDYVSPQKLINALKWLKVAGAHEYH